MTNNTSWAGGLESMSGHRGTTVTSFVRSNGAGKPATDTPEMTDFEDVKKWCKHKQQRISQLLGVVLFLTNIYKYIRN